jgi:lipopolysaccharide transport system permease protein
MLRLGQQPDIVSLDCHMIKTDSNRFTERVIRRKSGWTSFNLIEMIEYKDVLFFLVWRDIKVRYKQTALGILWVILQPLSAMVLFSIVFGKLAKVPSDGIPYPLFVYSGLLLWNFFSASLNNSGSSLIANSNLISKVYFPRLMIPASATLSGIPDFLISSAIFIGMCVFYNATPHAAGIILIPFLLLMVIMVSIGCGLWLSALNVEYRDFQYIIPFLLQIWMFATPIIYPVTLIPEKYRWLLALNPMSGTIEAFRATSIGHQQIKWELLGISLLISFLIFLSGLFYFKKVERSFADVI